MSHVAYLWWPLMEKGYGHGKDGFSLIETMIALAILVFGLLAANPILYRAMRADSLARSQSTAAVAAQDKLEILADLYRRNPSAADLTAGSHGPDRIRILNPNNGAILNRYEVNWAVGTVPDPRPGMIPDAKLVRVTITPIRPDGTGNSRPGFNKILTISTIFSPGMP